jgi:hypothetical protein
MAVVVAVVVVVVLAVRLGDNSGSPPSTSPFQLRILPNFQRCGHPFR